jgi:hypothetical protein
VEVVSDDEEEESDDDVSGGEDENPTTRYEDDDEDDEKDVPRTPMEFKDMEKLVLSRNELVKIIHEPFFEKVPCRPPSLRLPWRCSGL